MFLVYMTFLPLLGAAVAACVPRRFTASIRWIALVASGASLVLGLTLWIDYPAGHAGFLTGTLYQVQWSWFPALGASFHFGTDGISLVFVVLSALLSVLAVTYSWGRVTHREKEYYISLLALSSAMLGLFFSMDLLLFYLFWEAMLIPMYFLVGIWGGERRLYASIKFLLYTLAGSLIMLVAIVALTSLHVQQFGTATMEISRLYRLQVPGGIAPWLFFAFCFAFAVKTPLFPFHTWLPHAHVEAPAAGSVILAGILLKVGVYGFVRLLIPIFPTQAAIWGGLMAILGAVGVIYGGLVAWAQEDMKKLVAYSSISHLGFVVLGLFALNSTSMTGGILQGAIHGINSGGLFLLVGMLYSRIHTRELEEIGGLADRLPVYSVILVIMSLASVGLPATNGFVGEFMILSGSFSTFTTSTVLAATGVVISAMYMLYLLRRCVFGDVTEPVKEAADLDGLEILTMLPLVCLVFWVGLYPQPAIERIEPSVKQLLENVPDTSRMARVPPTRGGVDAP